MQNVTVHQLLHGYNNGHRLLAGSVQLDNIATKLIQTLSDLPGQGVTPPPSGYITAYPVPSLKMYAFAQTWLAAEMPRPGCVWTHTLLFEFTDLASIDNLSLLKLFQRPQKFQKYSQFEKVIDWNPSSGNLVNQESEDEAILQLLEALYSNPGDCVIALANESFPANEAAMQIWLKQWPRLRRNFRFCTWAPQPRMNSEFDLQFVPSHRFSIQQSRQRGTLVDLSNVKESHSSWIELINETTKIDTKDSLKNFLWRYGAECESGRAVFKPLVKIWSALNNNPIDTENLVSALSEIPPIPSLYIRSEIEIIKSAIERKCSSLAITFLINNLTLIKDSVKQGELEVEGVSKAIWYNSPASIWSFFRSQSDFEREVASSAAKLMKPETVLEATADDFELYGEIIKANSKLASSPIIWDSNPPIPQITAWYLKEEVNAASWAIPAMFKSNNPLVADIAVDIFGEYALQAAILRYDDAAANVREKAKRWLFAARRQPELLFDEMADGKIRDVQLLEFISTFIDYRVQSANLQTDGWARALDISHSYKEKLSFSFSAYIMARALSGSSSKPEVLIRHSFDSLHSDLKASKFEYEAWYMLEKLLPEVGFWDRWDRCKLLRLGVVGIFVTRNISPSEFLKITENHDAYEMLLTSLEFVPGGLIYMKNLVLWCEKSGDSSMEWVGKSVKKVIKKALNH